MTAAQQELFDLALLRVLDANRTRYGLTAAAIAHLMAEFGFPGPDKNLVLDRIDSLANKQLVEEVSKVVGRSNRAWRITESGISYADRP